MIAYAADGAHVVAAKQALAKLENAILFPLMYLMMALAFLYFMWGAYQYVLGAEDEEARSTGKMHMLYGIIGLFVMFSALAILKIAAATFGVTVPN